MINEMNKNKEYRKNKEIIFMKFFLFNIIKYMKILNEIFTNIIININYLSKN